MSNIGTKIYGYCNGYFGRDSYEDKIIVAEGRKWLVCVDAYSNSGWVTCANFDTEKEKEECIRRWSGRD